MFYNVSTCENLDSKPLSQALGHTHPPGIDQSAKWLHHWTNLWNHLRKLFEGSFTVGSVIMPDLDASGRKDPVRMRWRTNSSCVIGSANRSLLHIS